MHYIISYDITDNKRRVQVAEFLEEFGLRTQYSVFECEADSTLIQEILYTLQAIIDMKEDSLLCYALCRQCEQKVQALGTAYNVYNTAWQVL